MGNCCGNRIEYLEDLDYKQSISLKVIERDRSGNCVSRSDLSFGVLGPSDQSYGLISLPKIKLRASGCVMPGLDPRAEYDKECQDSFAFMSCDTNFLAVLFDGHGKDGKRVSLFCRDFMLKYFEKNPDNFEEDPKSAIEDMVESCDDELVSSGLETYLSGTTAVIIVINTLGIHAGSVGDSRAILASLPKDPNSPSSTQKSDPSRNPKDINNGKVFMSKNAYKRPVQPSRMLCPVSLTIDQKPNHEEELKRIRNAGGFVERLADDMGRPVGPYRVWNKKGNLPGLAMSRSIGDRVAHEIGVISTPIFHSFTLYPNVDQFIVLGSDGLWDVMDNAEVVNFVEKFRHGAQNGGSLYPSRQSNSSIARLLCEEARFRWFGVVEEEDVMIDDISCVVLEFNALDVCSQAKSPAEDRSVNKFRSIVIEDACRGQKGAVVRKDPTRGSMASDTTAIEEALKGTQ